MLTLSILDNNLNDTVSYEDFFHAFGYTNDTMVYMRGIDDKKIVQHGQNREWKLRYFYSGISWMQHINSQSWGVFFIVNGGGHKDSDAIKAGIARAQFIDFDNFSFEEQIRKLNEFPLEPSIIIKTRKSLHPYWLLDGGDIKIFRELQIRLVGHFGSDPVIINESRVMRLYGFNHCKEDPVLVKLIKFNPEIRYTQKQIHEALPKLTEEQFAEMVNAINPRATGKTNPTIKRADGELVRKGQRHYYVVQRCGELVTRMGDTCSDEVILEAVYADFCENCEPSDDDDPEQFRAKYLKTIQKFRATRTAEDNDPEFWPYAMKAWKAEHPGVEFVSSKPNWEAVREAGRRAKERDKQFDEGFTYHQEIRRNQASEAAEKPVEDFPIPEPEPEPVQAAEPLPEAAPQEAPTPLVAPAHTNQSKIIRVWDYLNTDAYDQDVQYFKRYQNRKIGFDNIDKYLTLYPGVACLGGASSLGKTTFAVNVVDNLLKRGEHVLYFALEQLPIELVTKSLARRMYESSTTYLLTNIDIKNGFMNADLARIRKEYAEDAKHYHIIQGDFHFTAQRIVEYVEKYILQSGVRPIVVIDYLQLIAPPEGFSGSQREITDENLKAIKDMSKRDELFVLLISSFNRASYKEPVAMESFKESGMIEYTCDYIFGLQLSILEDTDFFVSEGARGGQRENNNATKENYLYAAMTAKPKEVELVALKNRNGKQRFKCFFKYWMEYDAFVQDLNSPHDVEAPGNLQPVTKTKTPTKTV